MKKVIGNDELKKIITECVDLICNAVSSTLGPSGNNVIIDNSSVSPFITNDGVTIAESISSNKKEEESILEIIKSSALKTNELVGDGTTTTLVLLQSIYKEGLKEVILGKNPIELKKELNIILDKIIIEINKLKRIPKIDELQNIVNISCNDENLGNILMEVYNKTNNIYGIDITEGKKDNTYYEIYSGYNINIEELSNLYFENNKDIILNDCYILIINNYLNSLEDISNIINECIINNRNILLIVDDYNIDINNELLIYYLQNNKKIFIVKIAEYGYKKEDILSDIKYISECNSININYDNISWNILGKVNKVIISKDEINIISNKTLDDRILKLNKELDNINDSYEKDIIKERISKLKKVRSTIFVGGLTDIEIKEKKMRLIDALCALKCADNGVVVGEGITLLKVRDKLNDKDIASRIMRISLLEPFKKILDNNGISYLEIYEKIKKDNYNSIYNLEKGELESINNTKIIDPALVLIEALKNSVSIASLLLTTNYLVINDIDKDSINEYE